MIPTGEIRVEAQMMNPPKPIGYHVIVEKTTIAVLTLEAVKSAYEQVAVMEAARKKD